MSSSGDRHRRGPGGSGRPGRPGGSGRVTPPSRRRHKPEVSGLLDPTLVQMVATLLDTARTAIPPGHLAPGVALELWAHEVAATSFADEEMPRDFYVDLGRTLATTDDELAPAALAALALAVTHKDAAPLRKARADWRAERPDDPADLGIGREVPVGAISIRAEDELQVSYVIGFVAAGVAHSVGALVDEAMDGLGRDLFIGPPIEVIDLDAGSDPELVVAEVPTPTAAATVRAALAVTEAEEWDDPQDLAVLPLLARRLDLIR